MNPNWLLLLATLPTRPAAARMRLWRTIKARGCMALRDGAWLSPAGGGREADLAQMADAVRADGGSAEVLCVAAEGAQDEAFRRLFDRSAAYGDLLQRIRAALAQPDAKTAHALRREYEALAAIDYFPGEARRQAEAALAELAAVAGGEPRSAPGAVCRLDAAAYRGRTWATRRHLWIDRMACAWLIRRFIDRKATFLWLADPNKCPKAAVGFDFDGAPFTHVGTRVSFEVLAASFGLDADGALARIGALVHALDVGGVPVPEAAGVEAVLAGARARCADDDALLKEAARVFDALYESFAREPDHG